MSLYFMKTIPKKITLHTLKLLILVRVRQYRQRVRLVCLFMYSPSCLLCLPADHTQCSKQNCRSEQEACNTSFP